MQAFTVTGLFAVQHNTKLHGLLPGYYGSQSVSMIVSYLLEV